MILEVRCASTLQASGLRTFIGPRLMTLRPFNFASASLLRCESTIRRFTILCLYYALVALFILLRHILLRLYVRWLCLLSFSFTFLRRGPLISHHLLSLKEDYGHINDYQRIGLLYLVDLIRRLKLYGHQLSVKLIYNLNHARRLFNLLIVSLVLEQIIINFLY